MAWPERRGSGPRPWRARYLKPDGTTGSQPGFATRKKALEWGNDQEADIRAGRWIDRHPRSDGLPVAAICDAQR